MNTQPRSSGTTHRTPTERELFTGGKLDHPALTIYYNMAYFRMAAFVNHLLGQPYTEDKDKLQDVFEKWLKTAASTPNDRIFLRLDDYLWRGYRRYKNSSGHTLDAAERDLILEVLHQLQGIRNFHSHYWHDNSVLEVSDRLRVRLQELHDTTKLALMRQAEYSRTIEDYEEDYKDRPLFGKHERGYSFKREGRAFFLSLFLTRGEMARFLPQLKGFKRDDAPKFKIKRLIYTELAHRDGAARQHFGVEDTALHQMSAEEKRQTLYARQAYKILSYLNDLPAECSDPDWFPLQVNGRDVTDAAGIIDFCRAHHILDNVPMRVRQRTEKVKKAAGLQEETRVEQMVEIELQGYRIHLSRLTLHRLLLDRVLTNRLEQDDTPPPADAPEHAKSVVRPNLGLFECLETFVRERQHLLQLLSRHDYRSADSENGKITLNDELDRYYRYQLRGGLKLRKKMGVWLDRLESGKADKYETALQDFKTAIQEEPIDVVYHDFFFEGAEKPRRESRFVHFAVQYLMDSGKVPNWHWHCERFEVARETKVVTLWGQQVPQELEVNKRRTGYFATLPEPDNPDDKRWRLALSRDQQVLVGIYADEAEKAAGKPPRYKFLLGYRALRNLLIADLQGENIGPFLDEIASDLRKAAQGDVQFNYLTARELPASYRIATGLETRPSHAQLLQAAQRSIQTRRNELKPFVDHNFAHLRLRRSAKNRLILQWYTYYDWRYPHDHKFKFLRQDEHQQMSVYHYSLETSRPGRKLDRGKYSFLLKGILPHLPNVLADELREAKDLDDLLVRVATRTDRLLARWHDELPRLKGPDLHQRLNQLNVSQHRNPQLPPPEMPFDIHPILPLRVFFGEKLTQNPQFSASFECLRHLEQAHLRQGLRQRYYDAHTVQTHPGVRARRHAVGALDGVLSDDTLLWHLARKFYLAHTSPAYRSFLTDNVAEIDWRVHYLRQTAIPYPLPHRYTLLDAPVELSIKFHQLDDYLLVESIPVIARVAAHAVRRSAMGAAPGSPVVAERHPNGAVARYVVTYDEVFKELQRLRNESVRWAASLLYWEARVVDAMPPAKIRELAGKKTRPHLNFRDVLDNAGLTDSVLREKLRLLRNTAFHVGIPGPDTGKNTELPVVFPDGWSYLELEKDTLLCHTLGYTPKQKHPLAGSKK